ncbi:hypothetical protein SLS64_013790 [Diaporthe eres]|uniref:Single-strand DNA deaminase toxin A-like C-terminal domain-containing protein n=1 Tax=Diaporthe eres TaxID=83184 RepID=A0ABR1PIH9_DIAER
MATRSHLIPKFAYDIDKQRILFVAAGSGPAEYFLDLHGQVDGPVSQQDMSTKANWTEATETTFIGDDNLKCEIPKIEMVVAEMVTGNIGYVRQYLDCSPEAEIFLHGVEAYKVATPNGSNGSDYNDQDTNSDATSVEENAEVTGKTCLHFAACEQYQHILELLLQRGANPNAIALNGRFPLAEAALWGRLENVKLLLQYGADKHLECLRRGKRLRAIDFARPLTENIEERHRQSKRVYNEHTYDRDKDRKAIVRCLSDEDKESRDKRCSLRGFAFTTSPTNESLLTLIAYFDVPKKWKTISVLLRGGGHPPVAAMSGWGHGVDENINVQIEGNEWTDQVQGLCRYVGHRLKPDNRRDNGYGGQFHACHAEKQLIAFFVHKHLFLPHEIDAETEISELSIQDLPDGRFEELIKKRELRRQLSNLAAATPPISLNTATILTSRPCCDDCREFVKRTNSELGINIGLVESTLPCAEV